MSWSIPTPVSSGGILCCRRSLSIASVSAAREERETMLTKEQNELITQTGPGTPCGDLMRRYWQPIALAREIPEGGDPLAIEIFSEELVLFRDEKGKLGLLDRHCPHRGADLSYGRIEDGGLRCLYHGWLFDVEGKCLEQPAEPLGTKPRVCAKSYKVIEKAGAIWAYMGP